MVERLKRLIMERTNLDLELFAAAFSGERATPFWRAARAPTTAEIRKEVLTQPKMRPKFDSEGNAPILSTNDSQ